MNTRIVETRSAAMDDVPLPEMAMRPPVRPRLGAGVNVRTLSLIRWIAVMGQTASIAIVALVLEYELPLLECGLAVLALAASNIWLSVWYQARRSLSDYHTARILAFDLLQISVLIYLTGGLANPFSILMVVPVAASATVLSLGATLMLTVIALFAASLLSIFHQPLPWSGEAPVLSKTFLAGLWVAHAVLLIFMVSYVWSIVQESRRREKALAEAEAALAREQHLSALGALAAAAAHELGSPLNTISLIAKDLVAQVPEDSPFREDAVVLESQADRCRDILAALARRPESRGDDPYDRVLLTNLVEEAARHHVPESITLRLSVDPDSEDGEPLLPRSPEILQGMGNLIQNAGQFARTEVGVALKWTETEIRLDVVDDGPGFPGWILDSLGEPYLSTRRSEQGHMGLGIFIAQTLLDRTGAEVSYMNNKTLKNRARGARVIIRWDRAVLDRPAGIH